MALYHDYRPKIFDEVIGQSHIVDQLTRSLPTGPSHAYLMVGPHGTGKTTIARLIAAAVNCEYELVCGQCRTCQSIQTGSYPDVVEIDAASNRGIDDVRGIRDALELRPIEGNYKVYIVDEVHMLTLQASNALLKSLEEPPPHVIFILATTEEQKVIPTIRSRCLRYAFHPVPQNDILYLLSIINEEKQLNLCGDVLNLIIEEARGSVRDAISLVDLVSQLSDTSIDNVRAMIGRADNGHLYRFVSTLAERDCPAAFECLQWLSEEQELDMSKFRDGVLEFLRSLLLVSIKSNYQHAMLQKLRQLAPSFSVRDIHLMMKNFVEQDYSPMLPTLHLELAASYSILDMSEREVDDY